MDESFNNILIHSSNWVGDAIMSLPAIKEVRNKYLKAKITILIKKEIAPIFKNKDLVDETIYTPSNNGITGIKEEITLRKLIKKNKYDLAILLPNSFQSALRVFGCGIKKRIGYAKECRSILLSNTVKRTKNILNEHMSKYYLNILSLLHIFPNNISLNLSIPEEDLNFAETIIDKQRKNPDSKLIAFGIGAANGKTKMWGIENYTELGNILIQKYNVEIIIIASPNEYDIAYLIASKINGNTIIPKTNLIQACAILSLCNAFVGNDSGAMHLSSAVNIPTIGLYFSTDPKCNYPFGKKSYYLTKKLHCAYCGKKVCKYKTYECTNLIKPEEVIDKLIEIKVIK